MLVATLQQQLHEQEAGHVKDLVASMETRASDEWSNARHGTEIQAPLPRAQWNKIGDETEEPAEPEGTCDDISGGETP
eukprot:5118468-Karenia_brevis.AAC.1